MRAGAREWSVVGEGNKGLCSWLGVRIGMLIVGVKWPQRVGVFMVDNTGYNITYIRIEF